MDQRSPERSKLKQELASLGLCSFSEWTCTQNGPETKFLTHTIPTSNLTNQSKNNKIYHFTRNGFGARDTSGHTLWEVCVGSLNQSQELLSPQGTRFIPLLMDYSPWRPSDPLRSRMPRP